jgi:hypothetical protein
VRRRSLTYVIAKSPGAEVGGRFYPRNSLVQVDELATHKPGNFAPGLACTVPELAEQTKAICKQWHVPSRGADDDACFAKSGHATGSIADESRMAGVRFHPAPKADRMMSWNQTRRMLSFAGEPDRAGLDIARRCEYFRATVPTAPRAPKKIDDMDSKAPDHAADAVRYGCLQLDRRAEAPLFDCDGARGALRLNHCIAHRPKAAR